MLSLPKIQDGHHSRLLVLGRVPFEDLVDELVVLLGELEGDAGIVLGGVSMLCLELLELYCLGMKHGAHWVTGRPYDLERITGYPWGSCERTTLSSRSYTGCPEGASEDIGSDFGCHCRDEGAQWLVVWQ